MPGGFAHQRNARLKNRARIETEAPADAAPFDPVTPGLKTGRGLKLLLILLIDQCAA